MRHTSLRAAVKTRTFYGELESLETICMHCARKPARKRKKTDDGTSEQSLPVRLQGVV